MAKRSRKKESPPETARPVHDSAAEISPVSSKASCRLLILQALIIVAVGGWIYGPALHGGWLWDDDVLVAHNALVHDPAGLWKIWFEPGQLLDFQPIEVSAVWLEWHLWGDHTLGYHVANLVLHLLNALLVWRLLTKFGLRLAWLGGLLFAVHPIMVESVAWIAEFKNTFSLPLFLLAMGAYLDYDARGKRSDYFLALGLFLAAILCKAAMVMFPVVILLYAWWKRQRVGLNDLKSSAPFFVISIVMGLVTVWFHERVIHSMRIDTTDIHLGGFFSRLACAGEVISFYFSKSILPAGLLAVYPRWPLDPRSPAAFLPWLILGGAVALCWVKRTGWGRHILLGLGFFLINLAPFLGFNKAPYMGFTWVMDHILYLPIIGLIGLAVAGLGQIDERWPVSIRACVAGAVTVLLVFFAWESRSYARLYLNSETLWTYTLQRNPDAWPGHNNLGFFLLEKGRDADALEQFDQTIQLCPYYATARNNKGVVLGRMDRLPEAIEQFREAVRLNPDYAQADFNLGTTLLKTGRAAESLEHFRHALQIDSQRADAHYGLGVALAETGRVPEAIEQYQAALKIDPNYTDARRNLGNLLLQTGHSAEAAEQFEAILRNDPHYADFRKNLEKQKAQEKAAPAKN